MGGTSESKTKTTAPIKMKYFALFAILALGLAQAAPATDVWELFKTVHKKSYETEAEELLRKEIFLNNVQKVEEHNQKFEAGEVSFKLGVNQFSDLIERELRPSRPETCIPCRKNNWLNAARPKATMDAMEALWTVPSDTSSTPMVWNPSMNTHTLPAVVTAATIASSTNPRLRPPSAHTLM